MVEIRHLQGAEATLRPVVSDLGSLHSRVRGIDDFLGCFVLVCCVWAAGDLYGDHHEGERGQRELG